MIERHASAEHRQSRCGRPLSLDADTRRAGQTARRNVLFGLWASRRLGLPAHRREAYAWSVHFAGATSCRDSDVIGKVADDLHAAGVTIPERQLRHQLREMELRAYFQLSVPTVSPRVRRLGERTAV